MRALVMVAVLLGCDRGGPNPTAECTPIGEAFIKRMRLKNPGDDAKVKSLIVKHCVDDHWVAEFRTCIARATTAADRWTCESEHLTDSQRDKLERDVSGYNESPAAEAMAKMEGFRDKFCGCKDAKCAQDVSDEMVKWSREMSEQMKEPPKMTEADQKRAAEIGEQMGRCMQKAMATEPPAAPVQGVAEQLAVMESFKTKMCACKDDECARGVSDEMTKWSQQQVNNHKQPPRYAADEEKKQAELGEAIGKCLQTAMAHKR